MGKIIFLNPFGPDAISGGIKVTYQHAQILAQAGYDVSVYQPAGKPRWLAISDQISVCEKFTATADDFLVFPEILTDKLLEIAKTPFDGKKILFCQNHFYLYSYNQSGDALLDMGFSDFIVPGEETAQSLSSVLRLSNIRIIPNSVDTRIFYPREKSLCIATNPKKWPAEGGNSSLTHLVMSILYLKYPETKDVPWFLLKDMSQTEVADVMGRASIFFAQSRQEALPLTPLEAMSSRCILVGLKGAGGVDYATHRNGHWFSPEQCEEIADCLAQLIFEFRQNSPRLEKMLDDAAKTAQRYSVEATRQAVIRVYGDICGMPNIQI